jgi:hypothetical protein
MKLPAHVLTKLSLAGAVGAVAVIATLHAREAKREPIVYIDEAPVTVDEPEPVPQIHFAEPPPPRLVVHKKAVKPKPKPVVSAHACGPCGMG